MTKYDHLFPIHEGDDGMESQEVPIPMVALVATAVSLGLLSLFCVLTNIVY